MQTLRDASSPVTAQRGQYKEGSVQPPESEVSSQEGGCGPDEGGVARAELGLERRGLSGARLP